MCAASTKNTCRLPCSASSSLGFNSPPRTSACPLTCSSRGFWGDGDGADAPPSQTQALEELANLSGLAADAGQALDAFAGLGRAAHGLVGERLFDGLGVGGEVADGAFGAPRPQALESAFAEGGDVALH